MAEIEVLLAQYLGQPWSDCMPYSDTRVRSVLAAPPYTQLDIERVPASKYHHPPVPGQCAFVRASSSSFQLAWYACDFVEADDIDNLVFCLDAPSSHQHISSVIGVPRKTMADCCILLPYELARCAVDTACQTILYRLLLPDLSALAQ
jgi:hypothetical protein